MGEGAPLSGVVNATSGMGEINDFALVGQSILSKDPVGFGFALGATAVDTVAVLEDPLGALFSAGIGFVLDHLSPIKDWLNDLTGDAAAVDAKAEQWGEVAERLEDVWADVRRDVNHDLAGETGETLDAYREHAEGLLAALEASKAGAEAMKNAIGVAAAIVEVVHGLVRDAISDIVGHALSWAAEEVFSLGTATGWVIEQVSTQVAKWVSKLSGSIHSLVTAIENISKELSKLGRAGEELARGLDKLAATTGKFGKSVEHAATKIDNYKPEKMHIREPGKHEAGKDDVPPKTQDDPDAPKPHSHRADVDVVQSGKDFIVSNAKGSWKITKEDLPDWLKVESRFAIAHYLNTHPGGYPWDDNGSEEEGGE